ncbi:MAG: DUF4440 domain-containing protein [Gemmatimonadaceae bacterium]|nr:DUF4440 domain-containing protein [Gemmatimonadaceae bacterium]
MVDQSATIRALRRQSNAAIASLDANYVVSFMSDDIEVQVAGGAVLRGRSANLEAWETQMNEKGFGGYVRSPEIVHVAADGRTATERGNWVGRWRVGGRTREQQGRYTAEWRLGAMGWEIARETYTPT